MPQGGFEPAISASEWQQTHALDRKTSLLSPVNHNSISTNQSTTAPNLSLLKPTNSSCTLRFSNVNSVFSVYTRRMSRATSCFNTNFSAFTPNDAAPYLKRAETPFNSSDRNFVCNPHSYMSHPSLSLFYAVA